MIFNARVINSEGKLLKIKEECDSEQLFLEQIKKRNLQLIEYHQKNSLFSLSIFSFRKNAIDKADFFWKSNR